MTITTKAVAKVAAVATGLAMATSMLSLATVAHAQSACSVGTVDLKVGSSGAAVTCLQQTLIGAGYSIPAGATGYFGAQTQTAVKAWQAAVGITPASGYFGPISRSHWTGGSTAGSGSGTSMVPGCTAGAMFSSTTGQACTTTTTTVPGCTAGAMFSSTTGQACTTTTTATGLTGSGRLTAESSAGDVTSSLHEGDSATAVIGDQFDATDGDVAIQRVDATFDLSAITGGTNPSTNLNRYVSDVSLWLGSTKIASMDPAMGDKNSSVWTYRFSGLTGAVIKKGSTGHIYVKVTPVTGIGSGEDGAVLTAKLLANSVRAVGADGISDTYVANTITQTFSVSSATTGTLTVTAANDNPNSSVIAVGSSTTTGVKLLSFNMKAKNADVTVTNLKAQFVTSGNNLSDVVNTVYLMKGSTVLKSATLSTGTAGFVTFNNVNQTISKDSTQNYEIVADLKGDALYADGTTLNASTTVSGWDVSDSTGASVTPSAAAVGNTMTLTANGISVVLGTPTATAQTTTISGAGDTGNYSIPFTITAGDSDLYVAATTGSSGVNYATTSSSGSAKTDQGSANLSVAPQVGGSTNGDVAGVAYKVPANTARVFTLNVTYTATSTGYTGLQITGIKYGLSSGAATSLSYTSNLSSFKTNDINLVKH